MPHRPTEIRHLLDRAEIHDLLAQYFQGLDQGRPDVVRACFTDDVRAKYDGRPAAHGIEAVMNALAGFFQRHASGECKIATHFMGNLNFNMLEDDVAETETNAFAFLVLTDTPQERVAMRSLRYLDRLRRTADGWRICERMHTLDWSCHVPASSALSMQQRIMRRPAI